MGPYVTDIEALPPYTSGKIIDKAHIAVQATDLFETTGLKWIAFAPVNQSWPEFKENFSVAYEKHITLGAGTSGANNYYGATNAFEIGDDGIIQSIKESFATI